MNYSSHQEIEPSLQNHPTYTIQWLDFVGGSDGVHELKRSEQLSPDPSILVKGLNRLTRKTSEGNESLRFRASLARNALQVDTKVKKVRREVEDRRMKKLMNSWLRPTECSRS